MSETTITVLRHYREGPTLKVEAVLWRWIRGGQDDHGRPDEGLSARVSPVDLARARRLPPEYDPGLIPNRWVFAAVNDPAAKLPKPDAVDRGEKQNPDGSVTEVVEHHHHDDAAYWDYYRLPLRADVELLTQDEWAAAVEVAKAADAAREAEKAAVAEQAKKDRDALQTSARAKLERLGLTPDEVSAILGG